jgi:hypothetical protein
MDELNLQTQSSTLRRNTEVTIQQEPVIDIPRRAQLSIHQSTEASGNHHPNNLEVPADRPRPQLINGDISTANIVHAGRSLRTRPSQAETVHQATESDSTCSSSQLSDLVNTDHFELDSDIDNDEPNKLNMSAVNVNGVPIHNFGSGGSSLAIVAANATGMAAMTNHPNSDHLHTTRTGVPQFFSYQDQLRLRHIDPRDRVMAELYLECDKVRAPKKIVDKIVQHLHAATINRQIDLNNPPSQREGFMHRISKSLRLPSVESVPVRLESGVTVNVQRLDLRYNLAAHLSGVAYSSLSNLDLPNPAEPFSSLIPEGSPSTFVGFQHSDWYRRTSESHNAVLREGQHILHPLLLYVDKTTVDMYGRYSVEPVMITSTLLSEKAREDFTNWITLGLIPNLKSFSSAENSLRRNRVCGMSITERDYHLCLQTILEPLIALQREQPVFRARRGDLVGDYRHILPIAAVMGDNLSSDTLCARIKNHTETSIRMTRRCLTTSCESDRCPHRCIPFPQHHVHRLSMGALGVTHGEPSSAHPRNSDYQPEHPMPPGLISCVVSPSLEHYKSVITRLSTLQKNKSLKAARKHRQMICKDVLQKVYGAHPTFNAFQDVDFGANIHGITKATVSDILHVIEEGIVPRILEVLFSPLPASIKANIDKYVNSLFSRKGRNKSGEKSSFPRTTFTNGYTSLTQLTANERVGQLFVLSILLHTSHGRSLIARRFELDFDDTRAAHQDRLGPRKVVTCKQKRRRTHDSGSQVNIDATPPPNTDAGTDVEGPSAALTIEELQNHLDLLGLGYIMDIHERLPSPYNQRLLDTVKGTVTDQKYQNVVSIAEDAELSAALSQLVEDGHLDYMPSNTGTWSPGLLGDCEEEDAPASYRPLHLSSSVKEADIRPRIEPERRHLSMALNLPQFTDLTESILAVHSMLKYGTHRLSEVGPGQQCADQFLFLAHALENIRSTIAIGVKREENTNQFRFQKFVEMSHFIQDVYEYGGANGFDSHTGERGLKSWAKEPASQAQKRDESTFSRQVLRNLSQMTTLRQCSETYCRPPTEVSQRTGRDRQHFVTFSYSRTSPALVAGFRKSDGSFVTYPDPILNWFLNSFPSWYRTTWHQQTFGRNATIAETPTSITVYTETSIGTAPQENVILRAHPNYRGSGPWFDFAMVNYGPDGLFPARIAALFQLQKEGHSEMVALVQEVMDQNDLELKKSEQSLLFEHYHMDSQLESGSTSRHVAVFKVVGVSTLTSPAYCIDTNADSGPMFHHDSPKQGESPFPIIRVSDNRTQWPAAILERGQRLSVSRSGS